MTERLGTPWSCFELGKLFAQLDWELQQDALRLNGVTEASRKAFGTFVVRSRGALRGAAAQRALQTNLRLCWEAHDPILLGLQPDERTPDEDIDKALRRGDDWCALRIACCTAVLEPAARFMDEVRQHLESAFESHGDIGDHRARCLHFGAFVHHLLYPPDAYRSTFLDPDELAVPPSGESWQSRLRRAVDAKEPFERCGVPNYLADRPRLPGPFVDPEAWLEELRHRWSEFGFSNKLPDDVSASAPSIEQARSQIDALDGRIMEASGEGRQGILNDRHKVLARVQELVQTISAAFRREAEEGRRSDRLTVDLDASQQVGVIRIDGEEFHTTYVVALFVRALLEHAGARVPMKEVKRTYRELKHANVSRLLEQLPELLRSWIDAKPRGGGGLLLEIPSRDN